MSNVMDEYLITEFDKFKESKEYPRFRDELLGSIIKFQTSHDIQYMQKALHISSRFMELYLDVQIINNCININTKTKDKLINIILERISNRFNVNYYEMYYKAL